MNTIENKKKVTVKKLSPLEVYKLLPKTNCKECGEPNCLAFATKLVNREATLEECKPILEKMREENHRQLTDLLKPTIREVVVGVGSNALKIGGKLVMYRHELAYSNPTAIAIDVTDEMPDETLFNRVKRASSFSFEHIGQILRLNMIAVRSNTRDLEKYSATVKKVAENTSLPLILCSLDPNVLEAGLMAIPKSRSLLYAATKDNWKEMAELALMYDCPLVVFASDNLDMLVSLTTTLREYDIKDLVLDPGTSVSNGLAKTLNSFTMIRRAAFEGNETCRFPLIGVPMTAWMERGNAVDEILKWREAYLAAMLIVRYADILILHSVDGWSLLPSVILRQSIYTDPRKPVAVEPGLKVFGAPEENSPVMFTTNFALTYFTVASDIESAKINAYLIVVDSGGIAVDSAVAGRKLTAEAIAEAIKTSGIESRVKHRKLVIPGKSARLSSEIERLSGWQVLIGPKDSSDIPKFLQEQWQPKS